MELEILLHTLKCKLKTQFFSLAFMWCLIIINAQFILILFTSFCLINILLLVFG